MLGVGVCVVWFMAVSCIDGFIIVAMAVHRQGCLDIEGCRICWLEGTVIR